MSCTLTLVFGLIRGGIFPFMHLTVFATVTYVTNARTAVTKNVPMTRSTV
jgi:hypothetical protein